MTLFFLLLALPSSSLILVAFRTILKIYMAHLYSASGRCELLEDCTWLTHRLTRPRWMTVTKVFARTFVF